MENKKQFLMAGSLAVIMTALTVTACGGAWPADLDEGVQWFVDQSVPAP